MIIEEQSIRDWFYNEKKNGLLLDFINENSIIKDLFYIYGTYTGADAGFSFFAPNVSSSFILVFTFKDSLNNIKKIRTANFISHESKVRTFIIYDQFIDFLDKNTTENINKHRYLNAIFKNLAFNELKIEQYKFQKIEVTLYIFKEQTMYDIRNGKKQEFQPIKNYLYEL
ncbi:MAG: hypothetical protein MUF43_12380 [Flavobacterium sp.]|jgi:hypothetical protein|nr:hypothetical protein [Flavobacterium sp.]